jgi:hypothetical protein
MKNIFLSVIALAFFSCGGSNEKAPAPDSMNAIGGPQIQDTQMAPFPDGYATPNAPVDTSPKSKDSLDTIKH